MLLNNSKKTLYKNSYCATVVSKHLCTKFNSRKKKYGCKPHFILKVILLSLSNYKCA